MIEPQLLEAYCDGEASEADVRRIEAEMAGNPDLVAEVDRLFAQRAAVRAAYDDVLAAPVPDRTVDLIRARLSAAPASAAAATADNVVAFPARGAPARGRLQQLWWPAAMSRSMDDWRWATAASIRRIRRGSLSMARKMPSRPTDTSTTGDTVSTDDT